MGIYTRGSQANIKFGKPSSTMKLFLKSYTLMHMKALEVFIGMVSKLVHAVAQQIQTRQFRGELVIPELKEHFFKIRNGVWKSKSVRSYGAFPQILIHIHQLMQVPSNQV